MNLLQQVYSGTAMLWPQNPNISESLQHRSSVKLFTDSNWEENDKSSSIPLTFSLHQEIR